LELYVVTVIVDSRHDLTGCVELDHGRGRRPLDVDQSRDNARISVSGTLRGRRHNDRSRRPLNGREIEDVVEERVRLVRPAGLVDLAEAMREDRSRQISARGGRFADAERLDYVA